jgi:protein-S-isoprenylcysteine O-methyltransferase Ste14
MALVHEFEQSGNWLFKRRGWLPLLFLLPALMHLWLAGPDKLHYQPGREFIYLGVGLLGLLIRAVTIGRTPRGTSGRNVNRQKAAELNTSGIYSVVRHPLYLGNYFMWIAPVFLLNSAWFFIIFSLVYWIYYERIMFAEEQFLRNKFGEQYDLWSAKTNAFLPSFKNYRKSDLEFSFRNVLKREYHGLTNMIIIFAFVDLARHYFTDGSVSFSPLWLWSLTAAACIWITIRVLVKTTDLLTVSGR